MLVTKLWCKKKIEDFINHHYPKVASKSHQHHGFKVNQLYVVILGRLNQPHSIISIDIFCMNCLLKVLYYICHMTLPCIPLIFATSEQNANQYDKLKSKALYLVALTEKVTIDREKRLFLKGSILCNKSENWNKKKFAGRTAILDHNKPNKITKFLRTSLYINSYLMMNFTLNNPLHKKGIHYAK